MTAAELAQMCMDRELLTREIHVPNAFYGHSRILRRYAKWTSPRSLKVAIEHGVIFHDFFWELDLATRMPLFLCASPTRARRFEERTQKRATAIGAMIEYAAALCPERTPRSRTLLAFPAHSTHHVEAAFDAESFSEVLAREGRRFDRVVVCMYWRDYLAGRSAAYERRGFEIVSAGHMYDPSFLLRLVPIIRDATSVITNDVGSCLLYSVLLERPVWLCRQEVDHRAADTVLARDGSVEFLEHPNVRRCIDLFADSRTDISPAQREYVDEITGRTSLKSPAELHDLLASAEAAYQRAARMGDRVHDAVSRGKHTASSLAAMAARRLPLRSSRPAR